MYHFIDTHCHLYAEQFDTDRDEVLKNAIDVGVSAFLLPNIDLESLNGLTNLADKYPDNCYPMMGLHPCSVGPDYKKTLDLIYKNLQSRKFIAIGEIGLDYYWDLTYKDKQIDAFTSQLKWAAELNLPVAIHTRNSFDDAFKIVESLKPNSLTGVFHCFSGTKYDADKIENIGFYMGIGGVLTFKNGGIDKILQEISMQHLILETDAPYLAPVPFRGKRNEPKYIPIIAQKLAEVKGTSIEEIAALTTANAKKLFNLRT